MARVSWLGLGAMGLPMARRLIEASHEVAAYDPVPASLEALAASGGRAAASASDASANAELVVVTV
ncbi:MAG TPA: NAD(P)-binding domain-containing protein, partial [Chloroflexota bacterium]|nr:NAD(P)-binding domain-containing protein [Chloroflexota bacterium]